LEGMILIEKYFQKKNLFFLLSWTYDEETIDLRNKSESAQLDSYILNGEWDLESKFLSDKLNI